MERGKLIIYCGPSGVGKGTIAKNFLKDSKFNLKFSISATTRKPRKGEIDGVDYYFLTKEEFKKWINEDKFLEWAEFVDNYYGTPIDMVNKTLDEGNNIFLEIELQGVKQVIKKIPNAITIFIAPPSIDKLHERLIERGTEPKKIINERIKIAKKEMEEHYIFKYVVINDDIKKATSEVIKILKKELK